MKQRFQLLLALLVAALFSDIADRATWRKARSLFTIWFGKEGAKVNEHHQTIRMIKCGECPLFYKPLQTCGSHLDKETRDLGCKCFMPSKSRYVNSTCWLDDNAPESEYGWKEIDL